MDLQVDPVCRIIFTEIMDRFHLGMGGRVVDPAAVHTGGKSHMRNWLSRLGLAVLLAGTILSAAAASTLFLSDWGISYGKWGGGEGAPEVIYSYIEDWTWGNHGYLGPGWGGDAYDMEAAYLAWDPDYLYLAVVTGFPLEGRFHNGDYYAAGDIALDVTGDQVYDFAVDVTDGALRSGDLAWQNPAIGGSSSFRGVSDPLRVTSWTNTKPLAGFSYGEYEGRYAIEAKISLDVLGPVEAYKMHWTMGCGNDVGEILVRGPVQVTPEPGSLLLLGGGLAIAGIARRLRRKS